MKLFAHRGLHNNKNIPENSIQAFIKAKEKGVGIELDIRQTKDNEIVVFHDNNLKRMTGINKDIEELNIKEIRELYLLNTKEKIEKLSKIVPLLNNIELLIEIKKTNRNKNNYIEKIVHIVRNNKNITLISFHPLYLRKIKKINNSIKTGLIIDKKNKKLIAKILLKISKADIVLPHIKIIHKINTKKEMIAWTIKNEKENEIAKQYTKNIIFE